MNESGPRFRKIFFEIYENLPRHGSGNRACAARALDLCRELPEFSASRGQGAKKKGFS